jgi:geranylgeranyl pyrophosphate synthase
VQVVDDILDVTQTTEQLGKTAAKDLAVNKTTYPKLLGIDRSRQVRRWGAGKSILLTLLRMAAWAFQKAAKGHANASRIRLRA